MISKVISQLKTIDNPTAKKVLSIFEGTQPKCPPQFYSKTIFESQEQYNSMKGYLNSQIVGSVSRKMIETPLVFIRAKEQPVFCSTPEQGIAFGFTIVDYRSSNILVIVVIDKLSDKYEYKSIMFDKTSNSYIDSEESVNSCADVKELLDKIIENLNSDVDKWINKY